MVPAETAHLMRPYVDHDGDVGSIPSDNDPADVGGLVPGVEKPWGGNLLHSLRRNYREAPKLAL